jgi:RES domain-containing protein
MIVYRITLQKYSSELQASGNEARWNRKDQKVIYTAESRSLACLENLVHRSKLGFNGIFKTMVIKIPDDLVTEIVEERSLPAEWNKSNQFNVCQEKGSGWILSGRTAVLRVPSALIPQENNYILNTLHPDFTKIRILNTEDFYFDTRITS